MPGATTGIYTAESTLTLGAGSWLILTYILDTAAGTEAGRTEAAQIHNGQDTELIYDLIPESTWGYNSIADVTSYLAGVSPGSSAADPVTIKARIDLAGSGWEDLLTAINASGKFVALVLSLSAIADMTGTSGEFDGQPNLTGNPTEGFDPRKHTVLAEFHQGAELRRELSRVSVSILGKAELNFFIGQVTDMRTGSVNDLLTPGRNARITGSKIKIAGEDPANGLYFVNEAGTERVKVDETDIMENKNAQLLVIIPPLAAGTWHPEVTTQYTGAGDRFLKDPRTAVFDRQLTVVQTP
ncbi:MAG: DUF4469 domain-containing protein [Spirochaetaceae bacterium]|nr:DUF4469 domain-containing protein [Spirochaetaceae bacterium]